MSIVAIAALVAFAAGVVTLHFLRPDYSLVHHLVTDYANGPYGWLMAASFVALGVGCLALAVGLSQAGPNRFTAVIGIVFLAFVSLGCFGATLFPIDPAGERTSQTGVIHAFIVVTSFSFMVLASLLLSVSYRRDTRWRPYRRIALILAIAYGVTYALHFAATHTGPTFVGVTNRLLLAAMLAWLLTSAFALREVAGTGFAVVVLQKPSGS